MYRTTIVMLLLGLTEANAQSPAVVQRDTSAGPKSAAEIIARYVAAIGGEHAVLALKHQHLVMEMDLSGAMPAGVESVKSRIESYTIHPNKVLLRSTIRPLGTTETVYNGGVAWVRSDQAGIVIASPEQVEQLRQQANLHHRLHRDRRSITLTGRRQIDGRAAHAVNVVHESGAEATEYFDVESGLIVAIGPATQTPATDTSTVTLFSDYKRFDGILIPTALTVRLSTGQTMVTRVTHVDHGPIDTMLFVAPPEVRMLRKTRQPSIKGR